MFDEEFDEELTELIEHLIDIGALEILGYDSVSDNFTYRITDRCKEIYPELYYTHYEAIGEIAQSLWMRDIIDIVFTQGQIMIGVTKEQLKHIKENILTFEEEERLFLESILSQYPNKDSVE